MAILAVRYHISPGMAAMLFLMYYPSLCADSLPHQMNCDLLNPAATLEKGARFFKYIVWDLPQHPGWYVCVLPARNQIFCCRAFYVEFKNISRTRWKHEGETVAVSCFSVRTHPFFLLYTQYEISRLTSGLCNHYNHRSPAVVSLWLKPLRRGRYQRGVRGSLRHFFSSVLHSNLRLTVAAACRGKKNTKTLCASARFTGKVGKLKGEGRYSLALSLLQPGDCVPLHLMYSLSGEPINNPRSLLPGGRELNMLLYNSWHLIFLFFFTSHLLLFVSPFALSKYHSGENKVHIGTPCSINYEFIDWCKKVRYDFLQVSLLISSRWKWHVSLFPPSSFGETTSSSQTLLQQTSTIQRRCVWLSRRHGYRDCSMDTGGMNRRDSPRFL